MLVKKYVPRYSTVILFVVILSVGLAIYDDYGISTDEYGERRTCLVNYRYINKTLFGRDISKLANHPDLHDYRDKYYGIAIHMPLVVLEELHGFNQSSKEIYLTRHLWNFGLFFLGLVCFYYICKILYKKVWVALIGVALLWLYPRFFAESFYNHKDVGFASLYIITLLCMLKVLTTRKLAWCAVFAFCCALTTNLRVLGIQMLLALLVFMVMEDVLTVRWQTRSPARVQFWRLLPQYAMVLFGTVACYYVLTPAAWEHPFKFIYQVFLQFADYDVWTGTMVFAGQIIQRSDMPWYYIPVWMGISIPLVYIGLFAAGLGSALWRVVSGGIRQALEDRFIWLIIILFLAPLLGIIIFDIKIYTGWRHAYFLFIPFLLTALYGFNSMFKGGKVPRAAVIVLLTLSLGLQTRWIIVNHPYQFVFFNAIGKPKGDRFDRDYWRVAQTDILRYIIKKYQPKQVLYYGQDAQQYEMLNRAEQKIFVTVSSKDLKNGVEPDFIYEYYRSRVGNTVEYPGYREVYTIWVDGFKIASLFKRDDTPAAP